MLLTEKKARLKWNPANRNKYVELGYIFTAWKDEFLVEIKDITPTTRAIVFMECDYCERTKEICYKIYCSKLSDSFTKKDTCAETECMNKKTIETNLVKYGVESHNASEEIKKKKLTTLQKNYGEEYTSAFQIPEIKEKKENTNIEKYGVAHYSQTEEFKVKIIQTSMEKHGVAHSAMLDETKQKVINTNLEKYGVPFVSQNEEIQKKQTDTTRKKYGVDYYTQTEEYKDSMRGENHPNWRSDLTLEDREKRRTTQEYYDWRAFIFARDSYTCQCCGKNGVTINAHHKDGYHWCEERRLDPENAVTWCVDCHNDFHNQYGRKNNTEAQFIEFMTNKI